MKKYKFLLVIIISVISFTGCYDLDRYPTDKLSAGTFWQTKDHADLAMMGVYTQMRNEHVFGRQFSFDCLGSVGIGYDPPSYATIQRGTYDAADGAVVNKFLTYMKA